MTDGVRPSKLGTQPVGEAARVSAGVYQLKLPVPFPLRFVCVYLVEGGGGWTLVDAGYDYPPARAAWGSGAAAVGCDLSRDVSRIAVTHFHPDHLGAARWLQEVSGAPVFMMREEISLARRMWGGGESRGLLAEFLFRHGMTRDAAERTAAELRHGLPLPEEMLPLHPGQRLRVGDGTARVIHAPGHADHQLVLHDEERGILFAGDHLLLGIAPNIGLWPESEGRPLARYLASLDSLRGLRAELILPGHGPIFHDLDGRIGELLGHHRERLEVMRRAIEEDPRTAYAVSRIAFRGAITVRQRCSALVETLAHLEHLVLEGRAERAGDGPVVFRATSQAPAGRETAR